VATLRQQLEELVLEVLQEQLPGLSDMEDDAILRSTWEQLCSNRQNTDDAIGDIEELVSDTFDMEVERVQLKDLPAADTTVSELVMQLQKLVLPEQQAAKRRSAKS